MSIRAYKVVEIIKAETPTVGVMEQEIIDIACRHYTSDESGEIYMLEFEKEQVAEAKRDFVTEGKKELAEICDKILNDFIEDEEYLEYYCY